MLLKSSAFAVCCCMRFPVSASVLEAIGFLPSPSDPTMLTAGLHDLSSALNP
ncbi:hypothetical protein SS05631_a48260 (plasmid) [Sinorhizobium sp. CCBAU 05631]|nr:hypothetical protein SS05631_a48260 [Sinorhizobium sp. CCBAU 05631]